MLKTIIPAQIVIDWIPVQKQREYVALGGRLFQPRERLLAVANAYPGPRILDGRNVLTPCCPFICLFNSTPRELRCGPCEISFCVGAAQFCRKLVIAGKGRCLLPLGYCLAVAPLFFVCVTQQFMNRTIVLIQLESFVILRNSFII